MGIFSTSKKEEKDVIYPECESPASKSDYEDLVQRTLVEVISSAVILPPLLPHSSPTLARFSFLFPPSLHDECVFLRTHPLFSLLKQVLAMEEHPSWTPFGFKDSGFMGLNDIQSSPSRTSLHPSLLTPFSSPPLLHLVPQISSPLFHPVFSLVCLISYQISLCSRGSQRRALFEDSNVRRRSLLFPR